MVAALFCKVERQESACPFRKVSSMKKISQDVLVAVLLLIASAVLWTNASAKMTPDAAQFPKLILVIFILLSALLLWKGIRDTMNGRTEEGQVRWSKIKMPMLMFGMITVYVIGVDKIGFIIPSVVFPIIAMWFNYVRNKVVLCAVPVGLVAFLYVLFTFILKSKLP